MHEFASRALAAGIALALAGAAEAQVVISQVYGGAGQSGARYNADFVELHNNGNAPVDLAGWSLHYAPVNGASAWQRTPLSGVIAPGGYFLIRQRVSLGSTPVSAYDLSGSVSLNQINGKLALVNHANPIAVACPTGSIDFVGYGSIDCAEGSAPASSAGLVSAQLRKDGGCADSQVNAADFALASPLPRTRSSATRLCPSGPPPRLSALDVAQAEGQDGIAPLLFKLKLDRPAGVGGVSWSAFSNGQGTARPDQDYLPIDLRGTIPAGQSEASFALPVKGDALIEPDETVALQIKVHSGAVTANGDYLNVQATIVNDDPQQAPPQLSLHPVALKEGDADIAPFPIELRLDRPADGNGVRVRVSSSDGGTASADEDYLPFDYEAVIGPGQDRVHLSFGVRGDVRYEGDETVKIKAQILSGAIGEGGSLVLESVSTILDDDLRVVPIAAVQGPGAVSPLRGEFVAVEGIVTALGEDGFYLQSEEFESDGDPNTSQGLFVQTGGRPDPQWRGLRVRVGGTVAELSDGGVHPLRGTMTAIAGSPAVVPLTTAPRPLPPAPLLPWHPTLGAPDYEAFEGMRVGLPEARVVGPTGGSFDAAQERTRSDGRFHVALGPYDQPAPMREPGTRYPPIFRGQVQGWLPRWDGNPEVIGVDSDADGHAPVDLGVGARVDGVIGPLDQRSGRHTVILQREAQLIVRESPPAPPRIEEGDPQQRQTNVASYDLSDLYDEYSPPGSGQPATPPHALERRLGKISRSIRDDLQTPDLVAITGIENEPLLQRLAERINRDAVAFGRPDPQYRAIALPNVDPLKPQIGFLARSEQVGVWGSRVVVERIAQVGRDALLPGGNGPTAMLFDQAPLSIDASTQSNDGHRFRQRLLLVQLAPMAGSEADTPEAERQRDRRHLQAEFVAGWVQQQQNDPDALPLLVLGKFDAHGFNDGLVDPVGTLTGRPTEGVSTMVLGDGIDRYDPDLLKLAATEPESERYSSIDEGNRQELQHAFADERLIGATDRIQVQRLRSNAGYPAVLRDDDSVPMRAGDVDPLHLRLVPRTHADVRVWAGPLHGESRLEAGRPLELSVSVDNQGPDWARQVGLGLALSGAWPNLEVSAVMPGWRCEAPTIVGDHTSVACTGELVDSTGHQSHWFHLRSATDAAMAGRTVELAASVTSASADPDPANNAAQAALSIVAPGTPQP
ncbi:lamin tail domain-containing protein [Lysobacter sp. BMK333-48F3]|uniref:lamin tail domain-containing protein n=1 Tax=Lysobacter sp. BMK333-48F3 TaxID=2867962 RepID=UPI001C8C4E38|nr:lamin tail domain-containing protein [Lysobacter sp. BMK333-48F3]MBX9400183.1 lamin tail domain-containing protein [Lysobacter sp. BMK333-48F3]